MTILQETDTGSPDKLPIFIYIKQQSGRVKENTYHRFHDELERFGIDDISISPSFHLSKSNRTGYEQGFTNQPNYRSDLPDEKIEYSPVSSVLELHSIFQKDVSGTLFKNNHVGLNNYIQTDVLCFDIDNDEPSKDPYWDDEKNWITIESFSKQFEDYTFILSTSRNHMKEKNGRSPRPKFHVYFPLDEIITDPYECIELLEIVDFITMKDDRPRIDKMVGVHSKIFGNVDTEIYFNSGKDLTLGREEFGEGSVNGLLCKDDITNDYRRYKKSVGKSGTHRQRKTPTNFTDIEGLRHRSLDDWDYINIISKFPLGHWYDGISYKPTKRNYFMGSCGLPNHPDEKPSLMIFPNNSGFNCLGCGVSHPNPMEYIGLKTGKKTNDVRRYYCDQLGLNINDYYEWLDKKKTDGTTSATGEENVKMKEQKTENVIPIDGLPDPYPHEITTIGDFRVGDDTYKELEKINSKSSMISQGGKVSMLERERTRHSPFKINTFPSLKDFKTKYSNQKHRVLNISPTGKETETYKTIGDLWEMWKDRRQYDGLDFNPIEEREDYFDDRIWDVWDDWESGSLENEWRGDVRRRGLPKFMNMDTLNLITDDKNITELYDGCNLYLDHIERVICGNYTGITHKNLMDYILGWMTKCLTQHGRNRTKVALTLLGGQGSGKGTLISNFGQIFGQHFLHVGSMKRVTTNFNLHMMDKCLVYINECLFGGDKESMNLMKDLITEDTMEVEGKHMNSFTGKNHMNFMISSNEDFVVPIEHDGRRYMVLDISNEFVGKDSNYYFTPLFEQWDSGGKEYFYKFITSQRMIDKSKEINYIMDRPHTRGRSDQLLQTEPILDWFQQLLKQGGHRVRDSQSYRSWSIMKWSEDKKNEIYIIEQLHEDFVDFCRTQGRSWVKNKNQFGKELNKMRKYIDVRVGQRRNTKTKGQDVINPQGRSTCWEFGSLEECKRKFIDSVHGGDEQSFWGGELEDDNGTGYTPSVFGNSNVNFNRGGKD